MKALYIIVALNTIWTIGGLYCLIVKVDKLWYFLKHDNTKLGEDFLRWIEK